MVVEEVLAALEAGSIRERREKAASYVPSNMRVLGVPVPVQRKILREAARAFRSEPPTAVLDFARDLVGTGVHEARQVAFELVAGRADVMAALDESDIEALGAGNDNWASVDCFGVHIAGPAWRAGTVSDARVRVWASSEDRWWRRTALVAAVSLNVKARGGMGDAGRTLDICRALVRDRDPMVVKALSWALRSLVGVAPDRVREFLATHGDEVPALVRREVGNKLRTGLKSGR
jgi:3-methyladenine DNA glycosylase AlkD